MVMRMVTNLVLTVSDIDFFLSLLFCYELVCHWKYGIQWKVFSGLIFVGQLTYFVGIFYFGPRQEQKVYDIVFAMMHGNPAIFESASLKYKGVDGMEIVERVSSPNEWQKSNRPVKITLNSTLIPSHKYSDVESSPMPVPAGLNKAPVTSDIFSNVDVPLTFADLRLNHDDEQVVTKHRELFRKSLEDYGVNSVVTAVRMKNSINCLQTCHGCPGWRVAQFGFMTVPEPTDLAGLLNANALYSFSTGILQLIVGILMVREFGSAFERVLPMAVASVSLVLCLLNVVCDFAATLIELKDETDEQDRIWKKLEKKLAEDKDKVRERNAAALLAIEQECAKEWGDRGPTYAQQLRKADMLQNQNCKMGMEMENLNDTAMDIVKIELCAFRSNLQEKKIILADGGKSMNSERAKQRTLAAEAALSRQNLWKDLEAQVEKDYEEQVRKLMASHGGLGNTGEFEKALTSLAEDRERRLRAIRKQSVDGDKFNDVDRMPAGEKSNKKKKPKATVITPRVDTDTKSWPLLAHEARAHIETTDDPDGTDAAPMLCSKLRRDG